MQEIYRTLIVVLPEVTFTEPAKRLFENMHGREGVRFVWSISTACCRLSQQPFHAVVIMFGTKYKVSAVQRLLCAADRCPLPCSSRLMIPLVSRQAEGGLALPSTSFQFPRTCKLPDLTVIHYDRPNWLSRLEQELERNFVYIQVQNLRV